MASAEQSTARWACLLYTSGYYKRRQALDSRPAGNGRLARNPLETVSYTHLDVYKRQMCFMASPTTVSLWYRP